MVQPPCAFPLREHKQIVLLSTGGQDRGAAVLQQWADSGHRVQHKASTYRTASRCLTISAYKFSSSTAWKPLISVIPYCSLLTSVSFSLLCVHNADKVSCQGSPRLNAWDTYWWYLHHYPIVSKFYTLTITSLKMRNAETDIIWRNRDYCGDKWMSYSVTTIPGCTAHSWFSANAPLIPSSKLSVLKQ